MVLELKAAKREKEDKASALRKSGLIPAVFYGPKQESTPIKIAYNDFVKLYDDAGESTIIDLKEGSESHDVLIKEVSYDPVRGDVVHVDFYAIERGKKLEVDVELDFVGESPAEKAGAQIVKAMYEVKVESLPRDLPSKIEVDMSKLVKIGDQVLVKDLVVDDGVEIKDDLDAAVMLAKEAREEEAEPEPGGIDMDTIEDVGEKGKDEGGEGENDEASDGEKADK